MSDQGRRHELLTTSAVLIALSTTTVVLRLTVRFFIVKKPGMDDYMMLGSTLFNVGYLVCIVCIQADGLGFPMRTLTSENMRSFLKLSIVIEVIYYTIILFIKISIVFMYLRFAVSKTFRRFCYGTIAIQTLLFMASVTGTLRQCRPLEKVWDVPRLVSGTCINSTAFFYAISSLNISTDIWILGLPIPTLRAIHICRREKYGLYCVFGIGIFATALSIVRLQSIYTYTLSIDPIHDGILINLWSIIEINSAIVCANIPALKILFTPRLLIEQTRTNNRSTCFGSLEA
ncbi:uncharacterized protein BCR38DRAFT_460182 [Pseudomassariella vexata]|uniref:Integral membrane protein n=1 Tax=Pseudomassariella vexata TaxID=1141098 RepID=A0A1Y2DM30_9PEZI|nr:uncharacterized protein BCR38DRAFT_460182 [Pseudomassariella vexata]ORY60281.1 integral membrane protein [Pseudomassariella vexata]